MSVTTLLRTAASGGEAVTITYDDGQESASLRIVIPVAVHGDYLEAIVDPTTNVRILYKITKIASVRCAGGKFALNPTVKVASRAETAPA